MDPQQFQNPFSSTEFKESFLSKKNIITFLLVGITLLVIPVAVRMGKEQQFLKIKASGEEISFVASDNLECDGGSSCTTKTTDFEVDLLSPFGPAGDPLPTPSGVPSATPVPSGTPVPTPVPVNGPCTSQSGACTFDSREILKKSDGSIQESVTVRGMFWDWMAASGSNNYQLQSWSGNSLNTVPRYSSGPCTEHSTDCKFDSRSVIYKPDGTLEESVTAYGKYWVWRAAPTSPTKFDFQSWSGNDLTTVDRYKVGPCRDHQTVGSCTFDSQSVIYKPDGTLEESVTAYGKYWVWRAAPTSPTKFDFQSWSGNDLTTVDRYKVGPCRDHQAEGSCSFDSYALVYLTDGSLQESVTAYGKYWNWKAAPGSTVFSPMTGNGSDLTTVGRYGK